MQYDKEIIKIFDKLKIFTELYEKIRFVDPVKKKVLSYEDGTLSEIESNCYDNWAQDKLCLNCTSMRAYNENKTCMKMEHNLNEIYMVTSIPIKLSDRNIVIELIRNATMTMGFEVPSENMDSDMYKTIDNMNSILLKDNLTNIFNRRYINELLPVNIAISNTIDQNFSIIIADIDFFKDVNDTYGHLTGDVVLTQFASILSGCLHDGNNWIARYGGEEFMIGIHDFTKEELINLAEHMRKSVEDNVFYHGDVEIEITSSFGIACIQDIDSPNVSKLIDRADKNLYKAKKNGRNRIEY